ncbi:interferon alpha/beta receptor 2 [Leptodactylus fuscus]|uniref:interferon alpha/beta receptor 2 n=1 Tax=Leptodactylus fuscus TaxID=238119 RepID=UPI003F4E8E44
MALVGRKGVLRLQRQKEIKFSNMLSQDGSGELTPNHMPQWSPRADDIIQETERDTETHTGRCNGAQKSLMVTSSGRCKKCSRCAMEEQKNLMVTAIRCYDCGYRGFTFTFRLVAARLSGPAMIQREKGLQHCFKGYGRHRSGDPGMSGLQVSLHLFFQPLLVSMLLQPPNNLSLYSQNFQHVLTWEEPNADPLIYYDVLYSKDSSHYVPAKNCSHITIRHCDLTKYFTDIMDGYRMGVQSFTRHERSNVTYWPHYLNPQMDTVVGPPIVDIAACDNCIKLSIRPPISYLWNEKKQRNVTMLSRDVFPVVNYMIQLVPSLEAPITLRAISEQHFTTQISPLLPNTNYCVSVTITDIMNYKQVPSSMKCVLTKETQKRGDTSIPYMTVLAVVLAVGFLMILCALDKAGYIRKKKMFTPNVLKSLPNANYLLNVNIESIPDGSLIFTEIVGDLEVIDGPMLRAEVQENASYIPNNPTIIMMEQLLRNENVLTGAEPSTEDSQVSMAILSLPEVNISEEASDQAMLSSSIVNFIEEHQIVGAVSITNMEVPMDNVCRRYDTKETSDLLDNRNITIDLNSVSIADPGDLWTSSREEPELWHVPEGSGDTMQLRHFSDVLMLDESQESDLQNDVEDTPCEDQFPSDYVKR